MCFLPVKKDWGLKKPATQMRMEARELSPRQEGIGAPRPQIKGEKRPTTGNQGVFWQSSEQHQD